MRKRIRARAYPLVESRGRRELRQNQERFSGEAAGAVPQKPLLHPLN